MQEEQNMKMIVAIIRPDRFEAVQAALVAKEIHLMTVSDVRGCGTQKGYSEQFRGNKIGLIRLLPKVKLEIAVNEDFVKPAVEAILEAAKSDGGHVGDGKIFILDLLDCYRVRTGESGGLAIGP
jgi:nitrogen regulatory protein P-II 2